jgi:hypothetical protein
LGHEDVSADLLCSSLALHDPAKRNQFIWVKGASSRIIGSALIARKPARNDWFVAKLDVASAPPKDVSYAGTDMSGRGFISPLPLSCRKTSLS